LTFLHISLDLSRKGSIAYLNGGNTMKLPIAQQLNALQELDSKALTIRWQKLFKTEPKAMRREVMIADIAYQLQVKLYGGLNKTIKNKLERMAFSTQQQSQPKFTLSYGTQLVREWNGTQHMVTVSEQGFEYKGKSYRSLSHIACEITGTRWSGPLFFGLKKQTAARKNHEKAA
jgi:hypothetical protein